MIIRRLAGQETILDRAPAASHLAGVAESNRDQVRQDMTNATAVFLLHNLGVQAVETREMTCHRTALIALSGT
jgi:hypothetical protein